MTIEQAFRQGLDSVRAAGLKAKGSDIAVIAANRVFEKWARGVSIDPRFDAEGPRVAEKMILHAYAMG